MAWTPTLPAEPRSDRWWHELSYNRVVARGAAEMRAAEQAKRLRQLRRKVERVDEQVVLAMGASDARRTLRRQGIPYERSAGLGPIEHRPGGRVLRVR